MHLLVAILMQWAVDGDLDFLFLINVYKNELSQLTEEKAEKTKDDHKIAFKDLLCCQLPVLVFFSSRLHKSFV